jgi:hypothetical protein
MHTIRVGWWISLLHNSLFIKDKVEKKKSFPMFSITWATTIYATFIYFKILKVKN